MADEQRNDEEMPTLLVGVANPETTSGLIDLAECLARYADYEVIATHILVVPPQANLGSARGSEEMVQARKLLLEAIREGAGKELAVKGVVEVARDVDEGLISAADAQDASLILVGMSEPAEGEEGAEKRFDRIMYQVARHSEADVIIAKFRREDIRSILLPLSTGINLPVSGMLAAALSNRKNAPVTILHLLREDETEQEVREQLETVLEEHGMADLGEIVIEGPREGMDPLEQMVEHANRHDVAIMGADPHPSISESIFGSWAERVAGEADCTVLLVRAKSVLKKL